MKKEYTYDDLVSVKDNILFTLVLESPSTLIKGITNESHRDILQFYGMNSSLWIYGGRAPRELNELLSYDHLHKVRKNWLQKLCPYYKTFLPGLTIEQMWNIILKQREETMIQWKRRPQPQRSWRGIWGYRRRRRYSFR